MKGHKRGFFFFCFFCSEVWIIYPTLLSATGWWTSCLVKWKELDRSRQRVC